MNVIIVSGLPRSGTSLMMGALAAGGVPLLADNKRPPDKHNPRGYFEYEPVLRLAEDASWLKPGSAVKIIYRLLPHLPLELDYRVIFMRRPVHEVIASQQAMIRESEAVDWNRIMLSEQNRSLEWLERHNLPFVTVDHSLVLHDPDAAFASLPAFLERPLDLAAMTATIDPLLHRQR
jgi:hypothetical protein